MVTKRFDHGREHEFPVLDLVASFEFKSRSSISFMLGQRSNTLMIPGMGGPLFLGRDAVFNEIGRIDVHHPCDGHIKAQLLIVLPAEYHASDRRERLIEQVFEALSIPPDETFEALFVSPNEQLLDERTTDREGNSDRLD
jgi:hypothetical protein